MDTEVTQEFDRTLATFNGHPRYEIMPTGQIFDGDDEVMGYYRMTRTAFPDQRHDNVRYHVTDDTVIVEFDLLGTNLGEFYGLPPTGKAFRVPIIAVFFFDGDRIVNERVYFDSASLVTQIGRGEVLALAGEPAHARSRRADEGSPPQLRHHAPSARLPPVCVTSCWSRPTTAWSSSTPDSALTTAPIPQGRVGPVRFITRPVFVPTETAAHQLDRLGFRREDVRHIVLTHFDTDHVGGVSGFSACTDPRHLRGGIRSVRLAHPRGEGPVRPPAVGKEHDIVEHSPNGESWRGFAAAKELDEIASGIVLVSLPGHTRGHACVAVDAGHRWVLHCGDAFYHYGTLDGTHVPRSLWAMETAVAFDRKKMRDNHARLAELYRKAEPDLFIVSAHDSALFERAKATAESSR